MKTKAVQQRIKYLVQHYLSIEHLNDCLGDRPLQFNNPKVRPWQQIDWQAVSPEQVVGIKLEVFLKILTGAINTEAPIRDYTQTSRQYLQTIHPPMAKCIPGGFGSADGVDVAEKFGRQARLSARSQPPVWDASSHGQNSGLVRLILV